MINEIYPTLLSEIIRQDLSVTKIGTIFDVNIEKKKLKVTRLKCNKLRPSPLD